VRYARGAAALLVLLTAATAAAAAPLSDALKTARPAAGEWLGLYLLGKKVGYIYADLQLDPADANRAVAKNIFYFKASVGGKASERTHTEVRTYESKPGGHLLSFTVAQAGDGGDQTMEGTATPKGLHVVIHRRGQPDEVKDLPPSHETVEDADQARVALLRKATVEGTILDGMDLDEYKTTTTVEKPEKRLVKGVSMAMGHVRTLNEKEHVPTDQYLAASGATVELDFGQTMRAVGEPEATAKRLDDVEVFKLTRVVLPKALPDTVRNIPNVVTFVLAGLPQAFLKTDYRQDFKRLPDGRVRVTVTAAPPIHPTAVSFPLKDPDGGPNLKNSLAMELDNPDIQGAAQLAVGDEKDAYRAAKRVVSWVFSHMQSDYGASSDRASDALRQLKGDCTEHSLLSVAMLRSLGIPAKRIDGLVYVVNQDGVPALLWHEWVEAYVGQWTQLDPTFDEPVTDAAHLALGEETHEDIVALIGQLKVVDVSAKPFTRTAATP
jgi:transglutaminase-like putative cysteine protease